MSEIEKNVHDLVYEMNNSARNTLIAVVESIVEAQKKILEIADELEKDCKDLIRVGRESLENEKKKSR